MTADRLRAIYQALIDQGAYNIDLVTATQYLPIILPSLTPALPVPVVYNTSGYERVETLRLLEGKVQIYLPDLKYMMMPWPSVTAAATIILLQRPRPSLRCSAKWVLMSLTNGALCKKASSSAI